MAEITIEIDILPDGSAKPVPNPVTVADGDTIKWHINSNAREGGRLKVALPAGSDSPFGNADVEAAAQVDNPRHCNSLAPSVEPLRWPEGVTSYRYRIEVSGSPVLSSLYAYLFSPFSHRMAPGYRAIPVGSPGVMAISSSGDAIWRPLDSPSGKHDCCCCCCCCCKGDSGTGSQPSPGAASVQLAPPATRIKIPYGIFDVWTVDMHWSATAPAIGVSVEVMYPWPASPPPGPNGFNLLVRNQPLVGSYQHTFQAPAGSIPPSGPSGFVYRVEAVDGAGRVIAVDQKPWII